jgi:hypothetical protein
MKAKTYRRALLTFAFSLALMCAAATAAYALTDEPADAGQATPPAVTEPETAPTDPVELTPDGQMTLVDDISGDEATNGQQFLTIITKGGNYFYLIIDRAGETENVHFLNLVDEGDLLALIEDGTGTAAVTTPEPVEPTPTEPKPVSEPEAEAEAEPGIDLSAILGIILLLALASGGALFYVKVLKPKRAGKAAAVPSDMGGFDFDDDDDMDGLPDGGDIDIMEPDGQAEPYTYEDYEEREDEK